MKHLKTILFIILSSALMVSCATTYQEPPATSPKAELPAAVSGEKDELFQAAKRVLLREGYVIRYTDVYTGNIITSPKPMKLEKGIADCGKIVGAPAELSSNVAIKVALNLMIDDNNIDAKAEIEAEDVRGNRRHMADIQCTSLGKVENDIVRKIGDEVSK